MRYFNIFSYACFFALLLILGVFSFLGNATMEGIGMQTYKYANIINGSLCAVVCLSILSIIFNISSLKNAPSCVYWIIAFTFYMCLINFFSYVSTMPLKETAKSVLTVMTFPACFLYAYIKSSDKDFSRVAIFFAIITICLASFFFYTRFGDSLRREGQIHAYVVIASLTTILLSKKKIISLLFIMLAIAVTLLSAKRGGILAVSLASFSYLIIEYIILEKKNKTFGILAFIIALIFVAFAGYKVYSKMSYLLNERFDEIGYGGGSGRLYIWQSVIDKYFEQSGFPMIFGSGFFSVQESIGIQAHNEFLENLFAYGIVGLFLYIMFWFAMIKQTIVLYMQKEKNFSVFFSCMCVFALLSLVSIIIDMPHELGFLFITLGISINKSRETYINYPSLHRPSFY